MSSSAPPLPIPSVRSEQPNAPPRGLTAAGGVGGVGGAVAAVLMVTPNERCWYWWRSRRVRAVWRVRVGYSSPSRCS